MAESVAHRGPDGRGVWSEGPVGVGHRMLWTTPESLKEELPLVDKSGNFVLTADARLDNRDELIAALGIAAGSAAGRRREEIADGELILAAYAKWGERCPERLLGDFAFAVWDRRRQRLFCARDHMGVKPFYYYRSGRAFVFASEIKALLCLPEVPRKLNEQMVADYLVPTFEDKTITFYQEILRLPPAHSMTVSRQRVSTRAYWSLDPSREIRLSSDEEYAEAFREIFTEAVRCRLRSAFPVGSQLSGGLDSSSITCVARDLLLEEGGEQRLHTFSAVFDEVPECDESFYIEKVLARGGFEPHKVRADRIGPLTDIERMLWHEDDPFYAPNLFMHWGLYDDAHQQGVHVLLDGIDGDTTVSHGLRYLTELAHTGRWRTLVAETRALSKRLNVPTRRLLRVGLRPLVPEPARRSWRTLRGRNEPSWAVDTHIRPDFARRVDLAERVRALEGIRSTPARTSLEEHRRGLTSGIIPFFLEVADKAAAAFSIDPRYPFFDRRLVEFCLALPPEQKLSGGWTRMIMRRGLSGSLPEEIRWRGDKSDLSPNFHRGLLKYGRELLEEVIVKDPGLIEKYVDVAALREAYHRYATLGEKDRSIAVWGPITLALWLRQTGLSP